MKVNNVAPTVNVGGPYSGTPGVAVSFTGTATDPGTLDTLTYAWTFGDGATSTAQSPTHAYPAAGTYTVTLKVTDSNGASTSASTTATIATSASPLNEPLAHQSNFQYLGAFRVPVAPSNGNSFSYGGEALTYNPVNNSLFVVGQNQMVTEISIPQSIVNSTNLSDLSTASYLQPFASILPKLPSNPAGAGQIGGLMVVNGKLVGTAYVYYDASGSATTSHFVLSSLNLSTAQVSGLYQIGNLGGGLAGGYMGAIPSEWQSLMGAPYMTGQADIPIISRTSAGPAAFGFDPTTLGSGNTPATTYVYYPSPDTTALGPYQYAIDPLQNASTQVNGVVMVPGTRSVVFFGVTGANYEGYGLPSEYGDTNNGSKGPHSLNGEYAFQAWAYDAKDLLAVKQGTLQPWQVQPYDVWNFDFPHTEGNPGIGGVAFDPATNRLYVSIINADNAQAFSALPLIEVFQLTPNPTTTGPIRPEIGLLAVTPTNIAPGPIASGTPVTLTAANVYAISSGTSVTQVAFYLDTNKDGILEPSTDTLLGYGTPSTIPNAGHNYVLSMSTSNLASGTYTVFAQALDSAGVLSNPFAKTFTIQ